MRFHVLASQPHYLAHAAAVHDNLSENVRGTVSPRPQPYAPDDIVLVAGFSDAMALGESQRVVYVEHGAGQKYTGTRHPEYYHGSSHPPNIIGYISPRREVANSWGRPAFAAGAPICDPYPLATENETPIAVITMHWDAVRIAPEARSALEHYGFFLGPIVSLLKRQGFEVYGHSHPRQRVLPAIWARLNVETKPVEWVREYADLLICDNSSLMYEMAYLCRHVVALNAPWYRRDVEHGLRFWDWKGPQIDTPEDVLRFDFKGALTDHAIRGAMHINAKAAYDRPFSDGSDGRRAAQWLCARFA